MICECIESTPRVCVWLCMYRRTNRTYTRIAIYDSTLSAVIYVKREQSVELWKAFWSVCVCVCVSATTFVRKYERHTNERMSCAPCKAPRTKWKTKRPNIKTQAKWKINIRTERQRDATPQLVYIRTNNGPKFYSYICVFLYESRGETGENGAISILWLNSIWRAPNRRQ